MVTVWCGDGHESTIEPTVQSVTEGGGTWPLHLDDSSGKALDTQYSRNSS